MNWADEFKQAFTNHEKYSDVLAMTIANSVEEVEMDDEDYLYECFQDSLFDYLSNWRNAVSSSDIYHKMIHIWAEMVYEHLSTHLSDYDSGMYHHRLLTFIQNNWEGEIKIKDNNAVYYFIHNVVAYLGEYLKNIDKEYNTFRKKQLRWEIAELIRLDYYHNSKTKTICFNRWKSVSFRKNKCYKSYGQIFKSLSQDIWEIKNKNNRNKKLYPSFNYPQSCEEYITDTIYELLDDLTIFQDIEYLKLFKKNAFDKDVKDMDKINNFLKEVEEDVELKHELIYEFIGNYFDFDDMFYDGLSREDYIRFNLEEEDYKKLKILREQLRLKKGQGWQELSKNVDRIEWRALQWSYFLRLNFCSIDRSDIPKGIFNDDYMKFL